MNELNINREQLEQLRWELRKVFIATLIGFITLCFCIIYSVGYIIRDNTNGLRESMKDMMTVQKCSNLKSAVF